LSGSGLLFLLAVRLGFACARRCYSNSKSTSNSQPTHNTPDPRPTQPNPNGARARRRGEKREREREKKVGGRERERERRKEEEAPANSSLGSWVVFIFFTRFSYVGGAITHEITRAGKRTFCQLRDIERP
jgi:hypothetical protein